MMPYSGRASHAPILEHVPIRTYRIAHKTVRDRSWTVSLCSPSFIYRRANDTSGNRSDARKWAGLLALMGSVEERALLTALGEPYKEYMQGIRRIVPFLL
jgi:hypothetical protein